MKKLGIPIIIGFIIMTAFHVSIRSQKVEKKQAVREAGLNKFDLNLTGVILDMTMITNDCGVIVLKVLTTNKERYRFPAYGREYYVSVNGDRAYVVECYISDMLVGDSVIIDGYQKETRFFRQDSLYLYRDIELVDQRYFWDYLE